MSSSRTVVDWWMQRITALLLLPAPLIFLSVLLSPNLLVGLESLTMGCRSVFTSIFLTVAFYHGVLGIRVVLEDYVHSGFLRAILMTLVKLFAGLTVLAVYVVVLFRNVIPLL